MSRAAGLDRLPRRSGWFGGVATIVALALVGAGIAAAVSATGLAVGIGIGAVLAIAAIIVFHTRASRRSEQVDLFLLSVNAVLGWPEPDRSRVRAAAWKGSWVGTPRKLRLSYNTATAVDVSVLELVNELRRRSAARFGVSYRVAKHNERRGLVWLVEHESVADREAEEKTERVRTQMAKTFGADAQVTTKTDEDGEPKEITVKFEVSPRLTREGVRTHIESATSAVLAGRWRAFWDLQRDFVRFELRPKLESLIPNPSIAPDDVDPKAGYDRMEVPIGKDEDGEVIVWKPKDQAHGMVTGETGKGKTVVILGIVMYLAAHGWRIWGIDGKRIELLGLREYPNVELIAGRIDHQARVVRAVYELMQERMEAYESRRVRLNDFEPVLFVVDEFKTFRNALLAWYRSVKPKGAASTPVTLTEFSDIVSLGRKLRIHLLIGLQRPDAEFLTGDMRDNFGFRVSLGKLSPEGAKMMWQSFVTGTTVPVNAKGRGMARNKLGTPVELQTYWTPDPEQTDPENPAEWAFETDLQLVENLRPRVDLWPTKRIIDPDDSPEFDDNGKLIKNGADFDDYMDARIAKASIADAMPVRKMAGVFESPAAKQLEQIQIEAEEPDEQLQPFEGYAEPSTTSIEELLDGNGYLQTEGALVEVEEGVWGVLEFAGYDDAEDGYVELSYRDYDSGEPGTISLPSDDRIDMRLPENLA